MQSNELKKGDKVILKNGWKATIEDNLKGNIRLATVEGLVTEMGSIYVWDIAHKIDTGERIDLTPKQLKSKGMVNALGF